LRILLFHKSRLYLYFLWAEGNSNAMKKRGDRSSRKHNI
jgi:hypothetical protein